MNCKMTSSWTVFCIFFFRFSGFYHFFFFFLKCLTGDKGIPFTLVCLTSPWHYMLLHVIKVSDKACRGKKKYNSKFSSVTQSCPTLRNPVNRSTLGFLVHHQLPELPKLISTESVMPSTHLILCCSLLLLPSIFPSIRVFSNESALGIRWPKY